MDKISAFGKNIGSAWNSTVSPFAQRSIHSTQLPPEYVELEKRVDALKEVHSKLLAVTGQYQNEAYDYPPNIRESFQDLGRGISDKVSLLSHVSSASEAQAALTAPPSAKQQPKTFNHAIARASLASSQLLQQSSPVGTQPEDPLANALEKYALAEERVGEARLAQDHAIQSRFLAGWTTTLNTNIQFATKARRSVEAARLTLDATKAAKRNQLQSKGMNPDDETALSEEARAEIEAKEDEFVSQVEEAQDVMKNVLDTPEPLRNLADLIAAQLEYHKKSYEIL
ncbi:BAR domain-containing protein, partial [Elasticomyces elasticus]